ncbi:MAG TPA: plastocyanin/azurin family copper-binding protein [Chloroflexota bacterium]|jgi:plastocyanin
MIRQTLELRLGVAVLLLIACAPAAASGGGRAGPGVSETPASSPTATAPPSAPVSPTPGVSAPGASTNTVQLTDALRFDPMSLTVPKGTSVTWRNASQMSHTVTDDASKASNPSDVLLPDGTQPWDSGTLEPGQTFTHTFDVAGTYKYFCQPHEAAGMTATIVVTP